MPSKGAKSAKSWEPIEMTAFGMTAEDADLHLALCPWPMWIYTSGICLEQGTLLSCLVQRTIICCYAFWEITFVSNRFLFFWVIYWAFLTPEKSFFILLLKILAHKIHQRLLYFQNIWKRILEFFFNSKFISEYNMGGFLNKLWLKTTMFISLMSKPISESVFIFVNY